MYVLAGGVGAGAGAAGALLVGVDGVLDPHVMAEISRAVTALNCNQRRMSVENVPTLCHLDRRTGLTPPHIYDGCESDALECTTICYPAAIYEALSYKGAGEWLRVDSDFCRSRRLCQRDVARALALSIRNRR